MPDAAPGGATAPPSFDILDPYLYAGDPYPVYAWLRRHAPRYWDAKNGLWLLSKYDDVVAVSKNPSVFCSGRGVMADADHQISIITMDDPRHTQLRSLISRGFTPRMVGRLEPRIREIVRECIAAVAPRGECDFVADLAVPLPLLVIAELIGIRPEDRERFWEWSDTMILAAGQSGNAALSERASRAYTEYAEYLQDVFADRRAHPRDDLVSVLVAAQADGKLASADNITADELLMFMTLLLVAGNETTRNAISGGLLALLEHPSEWARLRADPTLVPTAVEEILRWTSPVISFRRTATRDAELNGTRIREGERVLLLYQSANRDEDVFPDADLFRIDRDPNPHIAFGIGAHYCLGANLARLEIRVMLEELVARLPEIALAPGAAVERVPSPLVRGIAKMPVVFGPRPAA